MMLATIVDTQALLKTVIVASAAGIGVTLVFSLAILGATRFAEMNRDGRPVAAAAFGAVALLGLAAAGATVVIGIIVMGSK